MMSSNAARLRAHQALDKVRLLLAEDLLAEHIDEPIDRVTRRFDAMEVVPRCPKTFHRVLGEFLQAIYRHALPGGRRLSLPHAQDEAVALLEKGYRGAQSGGYYAALLDAVGPAQGGLPPILISLAELLKGHRRDCYVRYVMARHIDSADWQTKCDMVVILLQRCRRWVPPELAHCAPACLVDQIGQLLALDMAAQQGIPGLADPLGSLP